MDNNTITTFDLDILGEIGNIGAGNAATALSTMINKKVLLEVPLVKVCDLIDIPKVLGGEEEIRTGVFFGVHGSLEGFITFILEDQDASRLCKIAAGDYEIAPELVISEISNIISGAYVGSLAEMINDKIDITPPEIGQDMLGSLIDSIVSSLCSVADQSVIIGTKLMIEEEVFTGHYVLMLEQDSLRKLLDYFNYIRE